MHSLRLYVSYWIWLSFVICLYKCTKDSCPAHICWGYSHWVWHTMKLVLLIKICLNETCSEVCIGKNSFLLHMGQIPCSLFLLKTLISSFPLCYSSPGFTYTFIYSSFQCLRLLMSFFLSHHFALCQQIFFLLCIEVFKIKVIGPNHMLWNAFLET
jgi:hypothetical protein